MIKLLFVGDGPRDEAMVPELVQSILGEQVERDFDGWARLHQKGSGRGYGRKLLYAVRQAQSRGKSGLVATLDADQRTRSDRLKELIATRSELRLKEPPFPTALGEAVPHGEAWLLDDTKAVRDVLELAQEVEIPNVARISNPKSALQTLFESSSHFNRQISEVLRDIARSVSLSRCVHAKDTGMEAFANEVRLELGPLCKTAPDDKK